ncbi:glutamate synthetase, putative [Perkinsus marinus ATCC 50983]|uniref:Glutamate synthetase, putative n=1 Tax=Perkinsus marinus (strain ATCC 50983 / TXsc) TaxID=423536 RepID=C5L6N1_PERM5|nr:glutamate synthetase, putative [Perkinsus marinus ATCC 50983]EER07692.1 glutamate synthetase, putative [Perkinsus marinus ATCC 50983]|eukprot:XP_002775876.1 glutamate synthetase, putative [Perkinsus marinus ATCC 50983]
MTAHCSASNGSSAFGLRVPSQRDVPLGSYGRTAVLVIDVQRQCSVAGEGVWEAHQSSEGSYFFAKLNTVVGNISKLLQCARKDKVKNEVIYTYIEALTRDCRDASLDYKLSGGPSRPLLVPHGSPGAKILSQIEPEADDIMIPKTSCSVFQSTNIEYVLRNVNVKHLLVVGQLTNQCVESCVRDAADVGFLVTVVDDACVALSEVDHTAGLRNMAGFARIITTHDALEELEGIPVDGVSQDFVSAVPVAAASVRTTEVTVFNSLPEIKCNYKYFVPSKMEFSANQFHLGRALLYALRVMKVAMLRYVTCDVSGQIRSKSIVLNDSCTVEDLLKGVSLVSCLNALPVFGDVICGDSSAQGSHNLLGDFSTLSIVPGPRIEPGVSRAAAYVYGNLFDPVSGRPGVCPRSVLIEQCLRAEKEFGLRIQCGVEVEFMLFERAAMAPVGMPFKPLGRPCNFSDDAAMSEPRFAGFMADLLEALEQQPNGCRPIDSCHAESSWGQFELSVRYCDEPVKIADSVVTIRQTLHRVADKHGLGLCLLPKPSEICVGSGMHSHWSFYEVGEGGKPLNGCTNAFVSDNGPYGLSVKGEQFMAGVLDHLCALTAVSMPTTNSFRRMVDGFWAGTYRCWAYEDKEAPVRLCGIDTLAVNATGLPNNFEVKCMDATCNPYLALAAVISCGLAGIKTGMPLPSPVGCDLADRPAHYESLPRDLGTALDRLETDSVVRQAFGESLFKNFLAVKRREIEHFKDMSIDEEVKALVDTF